MKNFFIILLLLSVSGCINTNTPDQFALHDFGVSRATPLSSPVTISVKAPQWLSDQAIHYRLLYSSPTRVRAYTLDRWLAPVPELFQQKLLASGKNFNFSLIIQLVDFEQQFIAPDKARVLLGFTVEAWSLDNTKLIGKQKFLLEQPTITADAKGAVSAFATLTQVAADRIQLWLNLLSNK